MKAAIWSIAVFLATLSCGESFLIERTPVVPYFGVRFNDKCPEPLAVLPSWPLAAPVSRSLRRSRAGSLGAPASRLVRWRGPWVGGQWLSYQVLYM